MITIIDYGMGNLGSIMNMLNYLKIDAKISKDIEVIKNAKKLILPGVGAFDNGIDNLERLELIKVIKKKANQGAPILGICLGMQLLTESSEEGKLNGLDLIKGKTIKFSFKNKELKIPHMGWNYIKIKNNSKLLEGLNNDSKFYFVHSYHVLCNNQKEVLTTTEYGYEFASIIQKENIWATQFHPEKSHKYGMQILKNFAELKC